MSRRIAFFSVILVLFLSSCNLPQNQPATLQPQPGTSAPAATAAPATLSGAGVQILSPADGSQVSGGTPVQIRFASSGGPFIEADLSDEKGSLATLQLDGSNPAPSGTLTWTPASGGQHKLTLMVMTSQKQIYSTSITLTVTGLPAATEAPTNAASTADPARAAVLAQVMQVFHDTYGLTLSAPPLARKYRPGVPNDPWISVVYLNHWMYAISVYPDHVEQDVRPIGMQNDGSVPIPVGDKAVPICKPAGTIKMLVALVDYRNLNVDKDQALAAVQKATQSINTMFGQYSSAGGAASPILQIQTTAVFISPAPSMPDHLLTPELVKSITGADPAAFDLLVQVDLDANNTRRQVNASQGYDTNGLDFDACLGKDLSIWMALDTTDQALDQDGEHTLERILSHELLHTFGYPADHRWPAGDGTQIDQADQSDIYNWPTLMLGWTDTDGDGIPEIMDPTPYR